MRKEGFISDQSPPQTPERRGASWNFWGCPLAGLLAEGNAVDLNGDLTGSVENYKIDKIQSADFSGSLEKSGEKYTAELAAGKLDMDKWLAHERALIMILL